MMQVVILAAGRGTRLSPLTLERSKAMMPIAGKPIVERVMDLFPKQTSEDFILVVHPEDREIRAYFSKRCNVRMVFQPERRGMANALLQAAPLIRGNFILSACDNLVDFSDASRLLRQFETQKTDALLALMRVPPENVSSVGIVAMEGEHVRRIVEKPRLEEAPSNIASLPLYCFSSLILDYLTRVQPSRRGEYELQDAIEMLIDEGKEVSGMMLAERRTLTNASDLLNLNLHQLRAENRTEFHGKMLPGELIKPYLVEEGVDIHANCRIGPGVFVESGARVGSGAVIRNAGVLRSGVVGQGEVVDGRVVG
jgi:dTDP-glucose pyrophosphorylase